MPGEPDSIAGLRTLLDDKNRELKLKDDRIHALERQLDDKDALIKHLQNEIDKFRQVVKPITQKIITKQINLGDEFWPGPGVENTRILPVTEPRIKRQAISAEPLNHQGGDLQIQKIAKSAT